MASLLSRRPALSDRRSWRITSLVAVFILLQALAGVMLFGSKPASAWFGTGSCPMPGGFVPGQKCLAVDANGVEVPWKGEIILPSGATSITDHALFNTTQGTQAIAGNYELQLVEDNGTCCTVYQTIDYTVASNGTTSPAAFPLNQQIRDAASHHVVGTGTLVGYFLFISNGTALPVGATCQNTVSFSGDSGNNLGSATSAGGEKCNTPTPVPATGALSGHVIDCTTGVATGGDITGARIAVTSGPAPQPAAANPVSYPVVPTGDYVESAAVPAGYHFVYTCGGNSEGTDSHATSSVHVPLQGTGVANFYVSRDSGTLVGHVYDCSGGEADLRSDVVGSTVSATGPANEAAKPAPAQWSVPTGTFTMTAIAGPGYHLVACNGVGAGSQQVLVPVKGEGSASFYVARDTGALGANIFECTAGVMGTTEVPGGTVSATGPSSVASQPNPVAVPAAIAGAYTVNAHAPASYHFIACGDQPASGVRNVTVPVGGAATAVYYVTHDTGMLGGRIHDCANPTSGTDLSGGTLAAAGPTAVAGHPLPSSPTEVKTGVYSVTATAPAGYTMGCHGEGAGGTQTVTVPANETVIPVFLVTKAPEVPTGNNGGPTAGPGSQGSPGVQGVQGVQAAASAKPAPAARPVQGVLGAATSQPNTGRADLLRNALVSLLLVLTGAGVVALSRRPDSI